MPWKERNGKSYYYKSVRKDGRVVSEYKGSGDYAEVVAALDQNVRRIHALRRAREAIERRVDRCLIEGDERIWSDLDGMAETVVRLTLESAGYHRPKRGAWRRRRASGTLETQAIGDGGLRPPSPPRAEVLDVLTRATGGDEGATARLDELYRSDPDGILALCTEGLAAWSWVAFVRRMGVRRPGRGRLGDEPMDGGEIVQAGPVGPELEALAERAHSGDKLAVAELRRALADQPDRLIELGRGDLAKGVEVVKVHRLAGDNGLLYLAMRAKLKQLRAELVGPSPSPIERLLAERAALCWLDCHASDLEAELAGAAADPKVHALRDRRRERAHRRYLSALKVLAQVRKLALPAIQVNIGGQQVNVAGS